MVSELASQSPLPELVRDARLQATIENHLTTHTWRPGHRLVSRHESWAREKLLGQGGNGVVWLERKVKDDGGPASLRAVKVIRISEHQTKSDSVRYVRELEALAKFSQNKYAELFVECYGWYESPGWLHVATEYCEHGDLREYLAGVKTLPEDQAQNIASQILYALTLMHEEGFAHRDLKPANILIKRKPPEHWWIKLCDFGLSKRSEHIMGLTTVQGTPGFMPPEMIGHPFRGDPRTANPFYADMWCLGEILHQTLTGHATFKELKNLDDFHLGRLPFPDEALRRAGASEEAINFIRLLMLPTPWQRLNTDKAWEHQWMKVEAKPAGRVAAPTPPRSLPDPPGGLNSWSTIPTIDDQLTQASGQFNVTMTQQRPMAGSHLYQTPSSVSQMLPSYAGPGQAQMNDMDAQNAAQSDQTRPAGASPQRHLLTLKIPKGKHFSEPTSAITDNGESRPSTASSEESSHTTESSYSFRPKRQKRFRDDPDEADDSSQAPPKKRGKQASAAAAINDAPSVAPTPAPPTEPAQNPNNRKIQKIRVVRSGMDSKNGAPAGTTTTTEDGEEPQKDYKSMTKSEKMSASMKNRWANGNMGGAVEKRKAAFAAKKAAQATAKERLGVVTLKPKRQAAAKREAALKLQMQQQQEVQQQQQRPQMHPPHLLHLQQQQPPLHQQHLQQHLQQHP